MVVTTTFWGRWFNRSERASAILGMKSEVLRLYVCICFCFDVVVVYMLLLSRVALVFFVARGASRIVLLTCDTHTTVTFLTYHAHHRHANQLTRTWQNPRALPSHIFLYVQCDTLYKTYLYVLSQCSPKTMWTQSHRTGLRSRAVSLLMGSECIVCSECVCAKVRRRICLSGSGWWVRRCVWAPQRDYADQRHVKIFQTFTRRRTWTSRGICPTYPTHIPRERVTRNRLDIICVCDWSRKDLWWKKRKLLYFYKISNCLKAEHCDRTTWRVRLIGKCANENTKSQIVWIKLKKCHQIYIHTVLGKI